VPKLRDWLVTIRNLSVNSAVSELFIYVKCCATVPEWLVSLSHYQRSYTHYSAFETCFDAVIVFSHVYCRKVYFIYCYWRERSYSSLFVPCCWRGNRLGVLKRPSSPLILPLRLSRFTQGLAICSSRDWNHGRHTSYISFGLVLNVKFKYTSVSPYIGICFGTILFLSLIKQPPSSLLLFRPLWYPSLDRLSVTISAVIDKGRSTPFFGDLSNLVLPPPPREINSDFYFNPTFAPLIRKLFLSWV
jgi:hypothetical protein